MVVRVQSLQTVHNKRQFGMVRDAVYSQPKNVILWHEGMLNVRHRVGLFIGGSSTDRELQVHFFFELSPARNFRLASPGRLGPGAIFLPPTKVAQAHNIVGERKSAWKDGAGMF